MRFFEKKIVHLVHRPLIRQKLEYAILSMLESNLVLVSGENEAKLLTDHFGVPTDIVKTLPVCVDERFCNSKPKLFESTYGITDFILLAGNRLRRKNVLRLLDAYSQLEVDSPLVIIGSEKDEHFSKEFCSKLSKINSSSSKKKVIHIENLPPSSELLKSAYASSRVFVLPSYYETPGIAALEAGIAGSNIAITSVGTTKEYFKNYAEYIDPCSTESIENAIEKAYSKPRNSALKNFILKNYSIKAVAQKFLEITKPFVSSV